MATFTALNGGSPRSNDDGNLNGEATAPSPSLPALEQRPTHETVPEVRQDSQWTAAMRGAPPAPWSTPYPSIETAQKRKRSWSLDGDENPTSRREGRDDASPPMRTQHSEPREVVDAPRGEQRSGGEEPPREPPQDSWFTRDGRIHERNATYNPPVSAAPDSALSDEQAGDASTRVLDHDDYGASSPEDDHPSMYSGQYTPEQRRDGVSHSDSKKRKRNFSNRTKTGCLTCRKRKKKCDESKPECSNCVRGGFVCAGYPPQRSQWPNKPENKPPTIQIESKDPSYVPPGAYGMPQPQQQSYQNQPILGHGAMKREPLPSYRGQPLRIEPPQGRPVLGDDERQTATTLPSASVASPDNNKLSALSSAYPSAAAVFPTPISAVQIPFPERGQKDYQRVPPLHDLTRGPGEKDHAQQGTTLPHIQIMHAPRTNSPTQHHHRVQTPQSSTAQTTAQLALSHTQQFRSNSPRREKDEMLNQRPYFPFDKELVLERERCSAACWRFNNSTNPNNGVSPMERSRLFREILQPRDGVQISPTQTSPVTRTGRVGDNTVVEAPFVCDYGYNINIGKNVAIGRNCTVVDTCEIKIGDNVIIGPNVSIYTATVTTDYRRRAGSQALWRGKPIVIEDDVFIGGNVIILPGVRIGRGTTVGAGSVVTHSQPNWCVVIGSPAVVRRGVADVY